MSLADAVTFDDVRAAAERIAGRVRRTPVLDRTPLDDVLARQLKGAPARVFLKCESLQHTGAFKLRGATNALLQLEPGTRGVLTYSSGNHAQAIARAGADLGVPTVIVMPGNAPRIKLEATQREIRRGHGQSRIVEYDAATQVREEVGGAIAKDEGLTIIPPYDHPHVIAGQGTAALELFEEVGTLDLLLTPCGGGGLLSGSAIAARAMNPACQVVGVEPAAADDAARSFRSGVLHAVRNPHTIADGTRTPSLGRYTFPLVLAHVDRFVTAEEDEILAAMRLCLERFKLVVEPSGALGVAGLLRLAHDEPGAIAGRRIGIVLSGGNVDLATLEP
ncbi:pyridoxal-5'-phosphate-dependent protein [Leptolyngbya valderiana BDU 20041]|nr:pyridoxal-5'-phosphate-dependent protein [Leptolyngbya valderiana BDU 20041]